jgi:hypothetical protein
MLNDEELSSIADLHARAHYSAVLGTGFTLRKHLQLTDPAGAYFTAVPSSGFLIGDGGFFVSGLDGRVVHLGSGEFFPVGLGTPEGDAAARAALSRVLRRRLRQ